jgi:hypothetical protein
MRANDRLAGFSNWSPWKTRLIFVLEDLELWDIVQAPVVVPPVTAFVLVAEFRKRNNKAKRTICDAVRDHIIPHLTGKDYAFEVGILVQALPESQLELEDGFAGEAQGHSDAQVRVTHTLADSLRSEMS